MKKKLSDADILKIIKTNWHKTNKEIGALVGLSDDAVRARGRRAGLPAKPKPFQSKPALSPNEQVVKDRKDLLEKNETNATTKAYKTALKTIGILEDKLSVALDSKSQLNPYTIKYKPLSPETESIAVVLASDWHVEEEVKIAWTNGMNRYNLEIAQKCAEEFFQNTVKMLHKERHATKIDTLVLALLGDFITNYLHEENVETCLLGPSKAVIFAQNLIVSGIQYLLKHTDVQLIIPCHVGNHSRMSDKVHFSTEADNSLETIMYSNIAYMFKDNQRVKMILNESYLSYLDIGGYTIAFHHGHGIKYGGAFGGITTSVVKRVRIWEQSRHADLYCFGHHHTKLDGEYFIANGSMIGYGARSLALGYGYEPRSQTFFLINLSKKRKTGVFPILFSE